MSNELTIVTTAETKLPVFSISPLAIETRDDALAGSALIGRVENAEQNQAAVRAHIALKQVAVSAESARKKLKEPVLEVGRQLDRTVAEFLADVEKEMGRLQNLTRGFFLAEQRRVREEEELQRRELERIEREKQAELRRIQEAQWRKEREAQEAAEAAERAAREARTRKEREEAARRAAEAEQKRKDAEASAALAAQQTQLAEEKAATASAAESKPIVATRAGGQRIATDWTIRVVNPYELAKYHPDCVKIEALLTPIKAKLNEGIQVRGVEAEKFTKTDVRARTGAPVDI